VVIPSLILESSYGIKKGWRSKRKRLPYRKK